MGLCCLKPNLAFFDSFFFPLTESINWIWPLVVKNIENSSCRVGNKPTHKTPSLKTILEFNKGTSVVGCLTFLSFLSCYSCSNISPAKQSSMCTRGYYGAGDNIMQTNVESLVWPVPKILIFFAVLLLFLPMGSAASLEELLVAMRRG